MRQLPGILLSLLIHGMIIILAIYGSDWFDTGPRVDLDVPVYHV